MSMTAIRNALEAALDAITPALATVHENEAYTPTEGTPYQRCWLLPAEPDNSEFGANYQEQGLLQVDLMYPPGTGPADASARAILIRAALKRGVTLTDSGVVVTIQRTPEIRPAANDDDRYKLSVRVRWFANINA